MKKKKRASYCFWAILALRAKRLQKGTENISNHLLNLPRIAKTT